MRTNILESNNPAKMLEGLALEGGWKVIRYLKPGDDATGGNFSAGYLVENERGVKGFLKALDYSSALAEDDPAIALNALTQGFLHERALLEKCGLNKLDRVVSAIASGKVNVDQQRPDGVVQYIIFEWADSDVRAQLDLLKSFDAAWTFRVLHCIATGLQQLHQTGIAHQDLKPSNVLVFEQKLAKVADLGRASDIEHSFPFIDVMVCAGAKTYAPPELLYDYLDPDLNVRRFGCDAYLLGSMIVFLFGRIGMTALLFNQLHESHRPKKWAGNYDAVLPFLRHAFGEVVQRFESTIPEDYRGDLTSLVRELCDPDPKRRGHGSMTTSTSRYNLQKYISRFDVLAKRAEMNFFRRRLL